MATPRDVSLQMTRNIGIMAHIDAGKTTTALSGQNGNGTVQNTQRTLNLNSEVNVTRGVDDVDTMAVLLEESRIVLGLGMAPIAGGSSGSDGDTTLLLLFHPVHRRR